MYCLYLLASTSYLPAQGLQAAGQKNIELFEEYLRTGGYPEYVLKKMKTI